ncbi:DinB/UmuC family translesion DNA polymerase [Streptomyces sp. NPDC055642]
MSAGAGPAGPAATVCISAVTTSARFSSGRFASASSRSAARYRENSNGWSKYAFRCSGAARGLTLTLKFAGGGRWEKTRRLAEPSAHDDDLRAAAYQLMDAADVGRRVRELLAIPKEEVDTGAKDDDVPDISSLGKDSPSGESSQKPSNSKGDPLAEKDIERLRNTLASLQEAAKKVNKSAARRAVEAQPDVAVPLTQEIGSLLQQIDRAVAIRLPKAE